MSLPVAFVTSLHHALVIDSYNWIQDNVKKGYLLIGLSIGKRVIWVLKHQKLTESDIGN